MKCVRCEMACATLECSQCKINDSDEACLLCEECSNLIHQGRMVHSVTERPINKEELYEAKKSALCEQLQQLDKDSTSIKRRMKEIASLKGDLQAHIRGKETELRKTVQELQTLVKDRCRSLYLQMRDEVNNQCFELGDTEKLLQAQQTAIEQLQNDMQKNIYEMDEDDFLTNMSDMEAKISSLQFVSMPNPLPELPLKDFVDSGDIQNMIQNICLREPKSDQEGPLYKQAIMVADDMNIMGNVYGRMCKDGTFLFQPSDIDSEKLFNTINIISASIKKKYIEEVDWETIADSGDEPSVGDHLFVMDDEYNMWLRGRVEEVRTDGHYSILFTDYGNIKTVSLDKLLPKRPSLYDDFPQQTVEFTVFDGPKLDIPNSARWAFADTIHDAQSTCSCTVISKVELEGQDKSLWKVIVNVTKDNEVTNVNDLVNDKIDQTAQGKGAITCRDVRLMDNPEIYSKLTTVAIEHPSAEKTDTPTTPPTTTDIQLPDMTQPPPPITTSTTNSPKSDTNNEEPEELPSECIERYEAEIVHGGEKMREVSDGEELYHIHQSHADSPSCDDYQSAASSLDEAASGSITPVSASSHVSGLPLGQQTQEEVRELDNPASDDAHGAAREKRKKKKKRRDSERSGEEKNGEEEKEVEVNPVQEDKPFILNEWLDNMGTELLDHKKLRSNLQNLTRLMTGNSDLVLGDLVLAQDERESWNRAVIVALKGKKADVFFVDQPSAKERSIVIESGIKTLLPKLCALPPAVFLPDHVQEILFRRYDVIDGVIRQPPPGLLAGMSGPLNPPGPNSDIPNEPQYEPVEQDDFTPHQYNRGPPDPRSRRGNDHSENGDWRKYGGREVTCFNCQQVGHISHDCPLPPQRDRGDRRMNKGRGGGNKKRQDRRKGGGGGGGGGRDKGRHDGGDRQWGRSDGPPPPPRPLIPQDDMWA